MLGLTFAKTGLRTQQTPKLEGKSFHTFLSEFQFPSQRLITKRSGAAAVAGTCSVFVLH